MFTRVSTFGYGYMHCNVALLSKELMNMLSVLWSSLTLPSDKASKNGKRSSGPKTEADKEIQRERLDGIMLRLLSQQRATKQCKTGSLDDDDDDDGGPAVC